jgi:predicted nucleic acid-binding Zn ribbon protein
MRIVAPVTLMTVCASISAFDYAWWVTVRIKPLDATYDGVAVETLRTPLKSLTLFNCEGTAPTFTTEQCSDVKENGARFEVVGDFNNDNKTDVARVGVAELKSGELVRVLLIGPKGKPKQHQVLTLHENGFSALVEEGQLAWYQCMECGHPADVIWDAAKKEYVLRWGEDYG